MKTIVIDAGHGGYDYGATAFGRLEKNDNLRLARLVADKLRQAGQRVILTRDSDVFIPLTERANISNRAGADLFVSLHRNAFTSPTATGIENFVNIGAPATTKKYAQIVLDSLAKAGVTVNRGVKEEDFSVLRNTKAPAQLLEVGFITNPLDNILFDQNIDAYATAIANGILTALGENGGMGGGGSGGGGTTANGIKNVQNFLNTAYGSGLSVDGIVGSRTKKALVTSLQKELNRTYNTELIANGVFDSRTKSAIPSLRLGARGNLVKLLQSALIVKGYPLTLDGIFGANTLSAVKAYQSAKGLTPDGIAGKNTFESLFK